MSGPREQPARPFAITLDVGSSLANRTGDWRTERPLYVRRLPPCNHACPAGEDVQAWLYEAEAGGAGYERAWRMLVRSNPFPAVMGRVCYHPCESLCNRGELDEAVGINAVERFLGDHAIGAGWRLAPPPAASGRRVLVVGSGPSGLSAAYHLALRGHHVSIREQAAKPGGMMRYGIPSYRLPRDVLDAEIDRILDLGVELRCGERVAELRAAMHDGAYDAAFLAVGAHVAAHTEIPGATAGRVLDAVSMLHGIEEGERPRLGRRVVVYGGGNTALDASRTAARLAAPRLVGAPGAQEAPGGDLPMAPESPVVVYRRTRAHMPADAEELEQAEQEGIAFRWLSTIAGADGDRLRIEHVELDQRGLPVPTGELEELEADTVILAIGQNADLELLAGMPEVRVEDRVAQVDEHMMTAVPGVFAGGDMVPSERNVAVAIGHGRRAARCIDGYLRDVPVEREPAGELARFDQINPWYYADAPRTMRPLLEAVRRQSTFEEVVRGLGESDALLEARRCLSCGNCFSCDNCFGVCPDNAVIKDGPDGAPYAFDLDYCKGCGMCALECPCGAIEMVPEAI
ncbi:MAG: NAD(P)-binding protein [Acidobacteriota bacterium]|nr:NAD(P)-binding protein [Acidobacteriota bacterium]